MTLRQACHRKSWAGQVLSLETSEVTAAERSQSGDRLGWSPWGVMGKMRRQRKALRARRESSTEVGLSSTRSSQSKEAWGPLRPPRILVLNVTALARPLPGWPRLAPACFCLWQPKSLNYNKPCKQQSKEENTPMENRTKDRKEPQRSTTSQLTYEKMSLLTRNPGNATWQRFGNSQ